MPWPEKDFAPRVLGAVVGAPLRSLLALLLTAGPFRSLGADHPSIPALAIAAASIASVASFWVTWPFVFS